MLHQLINKKSHIKFEVFHFNSWTQIGFQRIEVYPIYPIVFHNSNSLTIKRKCWHVICDSVVVKSLKIHSFRLNWQHEN